MSDFEVGDIVEHKTVNGKWHVAGVFGDWLWLSGEGQPSTVRAADWRKVPPHRHVFCVSYQWGLSLSLSSLEKARAVALYADNPIAILEVQPDGTTVWHEVEETDDE